MKKVSFVAQSTEVIRKLRSRIPACSRNIADTSYFIEVASDIQKAAEIELHRGREADAKRKEELKRDSQHAELLNPILRILQQSEDKPNQGNLQSPPNPILENNQGTSGGTGSKAPLLQNPLFKIPPQMLNVPRPGAPSPFMLQKQSEDKPTQSPLQSLPNPFLLGTQKNPGDMGPGVQFPRSAFGQPIKTPPQIPNILGSVPLAATFLGHIAAQNPKTPIKPNYSGLRIMCADWSGPMQTV